MWVSLKLFFFCFLWLETKVETVPRNSWQFFGIGSFVGLLPAKSLHSNPSSSPRHIWRFLADGLGTRVCCCSDADERGGGGKGKKREDLGLVTSVTEYPREQWFVLTRPFPSSGLVPVFQSESSANHSDENDFDLLKMNLYAKLIFVWKVSQLDSFWNRGTRTRKWPIGCWAFVMYESNFMPSDSEGFTRLASFHIISCDWSLSYDGIKF